MNKITDKDTKEILDQEKQEGCYSDDFFNACDIKNIIPNEYRPKEYCYDQ